MTKQIRLDDLLKLFKVKVVMIDCSTEHCTCIRLSNFERLSLQNSIGSTCCGLDVDPQTNRTSGVRVWTPLTLRSDARIRASCERYRQQVNSPTRQLAERSTRRNWSHLANESSHTHTHTHVVRSTVFQQRQRNVFLTWKPNESLRPSSECASWLVTELTVKRANGR